MVTKEGNAGPAPAGQLDVRLGHSTSRLDGCEVGDQPADDGLVTVESATSAEIKGTFAVDVTTAMGTQTHLTGAFDALQCP